jgi:iron complex outermembrane receptor protein
MTITTGLRFSHDQIKFDGCTADNGDNTLATFFNILTGIVSGGTIPGDIPPGGCVTWDLPPGGVVGPPGLISRELKENSWSWRLALNYDVSENTSVYGSYSRGFKSGTFPTLGASNSNQFEPVVQEQLDAFEIGFKATLADGAAQLNGALFYYDYTDKQMLTKISDPVFGRLFALGNVDDSTVKGMELDFQWLPAKGWIVGAAVSYTDSKIGPFIGSNQLGQEIDFDGSDLPYTPNWQATANAKFEWSLPGDLTGFVATDLSYSSSSRADYKSKDSTTTDGQPYQYNPLFNIGSYTIINARLGIVSSDSRWCAFVYARNLANKFYITNIVQAVDMRVRYVGRPATYGVSLQFNW